MVSLNLIGALVSTETSLSSELVGMHSEHCLQSDRTTKLKHSISFKTLFQNKPNEPGPNHLLIKVESLGKVILTTVSNLFILVYYIKMFD